IRQVEKMISEGADIIDIGAYSSKPSAEFVSEQDEINRLKVVIKELVNTFPSVVLSVDTFRASVAKFAVDQGVAMVNDISAGLLDDAMLPTVAELKVPYIMMHMRGTPQTMQSLTQYDDVVKEMLFYFSERIQKARSFGISDLIIDPGFGFAKTVEQNYEVLQKLELFSILELPLLVGISRKSMIYKVLETTPQEALNGTTVINTIALQKGAKILRVHDVKEAVECVKLVSQLQ
ncbi:dihydropteroate synthase, partial [Flavobacterium sp.]|uniref:dihydropteroate synthase n=1 Tax=Flavobacterium sp. TaxID=239 RepID=UPI0037C05256